MTKKTSTQTSEQTRGQPFDAGALLDMFDPGKMMTQFQQAVQNLQGADLGALAEGQRRNIDALTEANRKVLLGAQNLVQKQTEMMQQVALEAAAATQTLISGDPAELPAKQAQIVQQAYARAAEHVREVSETVASAQQQALDTLNRRWQESLQELQALAKKG